MKAFITSLQRTRISSGWLFAFVAAFQVFALASVVSAAAASERSALSSGQNVVFVTSIVTGALLPTSQRCQDPISLLPKDFDASRGDLTGLQKVMACLHLDAYAASTKPLQFNGSDPKNLCSVVWEKGEPQWFDPKERKILALHGTKQKRIPTRAELLAQGFKVRTAPERNAYLLASEKIRNRMAGVCCAGETACLSAMRAVRVTSCVSEADQNPKLVDPCADVNGEYLMSNVEKRELQEFTLGKPRDRVLSGGIVLSPYVFASGNSVAAEATVRHELGHACTVIRRQISALKGAENAMNASESLDAQMSGSCNGSFVNDTAYVGVFNGASADAGEKVLSCLKVQTKKSLEPKSTVFFEETCEGFKLEEGIAEGLSIAGTQNLIPNGYPNRFCRATPSRQHMASAEVLACLLNNDPRLRAKFRSSLGCDGAAQ